MRDAIKFYVQNSPAGLGRVFLDLLVDTALTDDWEVTVELSEQVPEFVDTVTPWGHVPNTNDQTKTLVLRKDGFCFTLSHSGMHGIYQKEPVKDLTDPLALSLMLLFGN
jgi:hypothetical protein